MTKGSVSADGGDKRKRGSGVTTVYETLRREIIDLTLPPGSPLDEAQLSERFEMSRTPIREALVRLAADNLITTLTNRATIVAPIDFLHLSDFFDALTLMYRVTTREAAVNRTAADLERIREFQSAFAASVEARDPLLMIATNRDFHVAIAEAGGNRYYIDLFSRLLDEGRRILRLYYSSFNDELPRRYVTEHEDMIDAIAAGDVVRADALAIAHADQIVQQIQSYIAADWRTTRSIAL
ncbi:GntR family transcriptional regulator [Pelagibacterium xiamenense]|uniref:GntR family transcriptional regulator n=1 Tax=Pelagibacterium xiamenense TaxID=2901140 RepID=UPI001E5D5DAB|nr:GntR family transcriptional regulator [Pelagibacterium xiamenense]MCD7061426.1 GntR family transcriptional regulator [Pelagibacterium xiamenense]